MLLKVGFLLFSGDCIAERVKKIIYNTIDKIDDFLDRYPYVGLGFIAGSTILGGFLGHSIAGTETVHYPEKIIEIGNIIIHRLPYDRIIYRGASIGALKGFLSSLGPLVAVDHISAKNSWNKNYEEMKNEI